MAYQLEAKRCSCCHVCKTQCPASAIRFKGSKYWIDPEKCIDCGVCEELCNNSAITNPANPPKIVPHEKIVKSCDVVVCGGGAAGLIAAAKAASEGLKVILLEKEKKLGGSCWFAGGYRTWSSNVHKQFGIEEDPRKELYEQFLDKVGEDNVDSDLLWRIFEANGEMIDWIYERGDMKDRFNVGKNPWGKQAVSIDMPNVENPIRIDPTIGPGSMGSAWVVTMSGLCDKFGVETLTGVAASELIVDESGKLTGITAKDDGGEYEISCKACVLATGAMTHNDELAERVTPGFADDGINEPVHKFTAPGCTGDGIVMCEKIGADIDWVNTRCAMFGPAHHPFPYPGLALTRSPYGIVVNKEGIDFMSGGGGGMVQMAELLKKQPEHICYQILDSTMVEKAAEFNLQGKGDGNGTEIMRGWREGLEEEVALGKPVLRADSIEELAEMIGADPAVLKKTIADYNASCPENVEDDKDAPPMMMRKIEIPIKDGPFYAFIQKFFHENAVGGMTIDSKCRVLKGGKPIEGLYASGDTTRGIMVGGELGVHYVESVITALTSAVTLGYLSGDEASKYAGA